MMGFAQLGLFAGYSIYFPELFPTRLRGTGVGFCYNTVRYLAAPAPILFGYLVDPHVVPRGGDLDGLCLPDRGHGADLGAGNERAAATGRLERQMLSSGRASVVADVLDELPRRRRPRLFGCAETCESRRPSAIHAVQSPDLA